jgi:pyrimidine operon attenuation protein / uracil phosphoribosyltransferase
VQNPGDRHLGDASTIQGLVSTLAVEIAAGRHADIPLRLIGVRTRGVPLAERLAAALHGRTGTDVPVGAVDITLYRDDLGRSQTWPVLHGTEIPFSIEGADVVLVDDVLFTGRTIRAALNAICDLGRPASVRLAVLVDRGHRELPIRADFVGLEVTTDRADHVRVRLRPVDPVDEIVADGTGVAATPPTHPAPPDARSQP